MIITAVFYNALHVYTIKLFRLNLDQIQSINHYYLLDDQLSRPADMSQSGGLRRGIAS